MLIKGVTLPDWLVAYKTSNSSEKSISPDCVLDPEAAVRGVGWRTSIDPTGGVIFDVKSFAEPENMEEVIPLVAKLKSLGFNVYLLCGNQGRKYLHEAGDDFKDLPKNIKNLDEFDEKTDYSLCAQKNLARDKVVLIDWTKTKELKRDLDSVRRSKGDFQSSHLKGGFYVSLPNDVKIPTKRKRMFALGSEEFVYFGRKFVGGYHPDIDEKNLDLIEQNLKNSEDFSPIFFEFLLGSPVPMAIGVRNFRMSLGKISSHIKDRELRKEIVERFMIDGSIDSIENSIKDILPMEDRDLIGNLLGILAALDGFPQAQEKLVQLIDVLIDKMPEEKRCDLFYLLRDYNFFAPNLKSFPETQGKLIDFEFFVHEGRLEEWLKIIPDLAPETLVHRALSDNSLDGYDDYYEALCYCFGALTPDAAKAFPDLVGKFVSKAEKMIKEGENPLVFVSSARNFPVIQKEFFDKVDQSKIRGAGAEISDVVYSVCYLEPDLTAIKGDYLIDELLKNFSKDQIRKEFERETHALWALRDPAFNKFSKDKVETLRWIVDCEDLWWMANVDGDNLNQESREKLQELQKEFLSDVPNKFDQTKGFPFLQKALIEKFWQKMSLYHKSLVAAKLESDLPFLRKKLMTDIAEELVNERKSGLFFDLINSEPRLLEEIALSDQLMSSKMMLYLLQNSFSNNDIESSTKPCSLHISRLTEENIGELEKYRENLSEVATASIARVEDINLVEKLFGYFPKVCHFVLPGNVLDEFRRKFPDISCESGDLGFDLVKLCLDAEKERSERYRGGGFYGVSDQSKLGAKSNFNTDDSLNSEVPKIKLAKVLNDQSAPNPSIRTQVIQRDIVNGLRQQDYVPGQSAMVDVAIENPLLTSKKIQEFESRSSQEGLYYLMGAELKKDQMVRLNSASSDEEFMGYFSKNSAAKIVIKKGDDDFLYAASDQDCSISFVTKVAANLNDYRAIGLGENFYIDKIREYLGNPKYKSNADPNQYFPKYDPNHHQEWLQKLFDDCLGVCRHRVAAVEYFLKINGIGEQDLRVVGINQNHEILEIRHQGKWYPIDLGGGGRVVGSVDKTKNFDLPTKKNDAENILSPEEINFAELPEDPDLVVLKTKLDFLLREKIEPEKILRSANDLFLNSLNSDKKKILIITNKNNEAHANFLLAEATKQRRKFFYIDKPNDIDLDRPSLFIDKNGDAEIRKEGQFDQFLSSLTQDEPSLLLINWDNFTAQQKVALNSIIDRERSINGRKLPESLCLIGLSEKLPKDASFLSRHDLVVRSNLSEEELLPSLRKYKASQPPVEIDLAGFGDYRGKLFGRISIERTALHWQKNESDFVLGLEAGAKNFNIFNLSFEGRESLEYEFKQAKARGYLNYHGYKIPFGGDVEISFGAREYDFSAFQNHQIVTGFTSGQLENRPDCHVVNSQLFDRLLYGKKIEQEFYQEIPGLIESKAGKNLELFITSDLSNSQWFCLFKKAADFGVFLDIKVAQKVLLPNGLTSEKSSHETILPQQNHPKIILTNDATHIQIEANSSVIDIEDFAYQDFQKIDFEFENGVFGKFKFIESELLKKMKSASNRVVIRGEFDPELLKMMHPILLAHGEFNGISNNLTFIIEDKNISDKTRDCQELSFLGEDALEILYFPQTNARKNHQNNFVEDNKEFDSLEENSQEKAREFIERRKKKFHEFLRDNSLLKLSGHSGVGKSSLIEEVAKNNDVSMYHEIGSLENFANDNSGDKIKILFIDEANIDDVDFTRFSQLKNGGNKEIFYQGKFYQLGENHKIVFAGNDKSYGGGRSEQKLFADGSVPTMHLGDFPASYIYEVLLREPLEQGSDEELFRKKCAEFIASYQAHNAAQDDEKKKLTVRELQERVLQFLSQKNREDEEIQPINSEYFVSTNATEAAEKSLRLAINLRKEQHREATSGKVLGTSGVLLKGDSGIGKSEMIREVFKQESIQEATPATPINHDSQYYYRIGSRLPLPQKKEIILKAFREGNMVWIDELNSCIDDGLEKILNAVLTGVDPDSKKLAERPGFMVIATANEIDMEGRSMISPAILHRMNYIEMPKLNFYDHEDLVKVIGHFLQKKNPDSVNEEQVQAFTKSFELLRKDYGEYLNFRVFESVLSEYFIKEKQPQEDEIMAAANSFGCSGWISSFFDRFTKSKKSTKDDPENPSNDLRLQSAKSLAPAKAPTTSK